MISARFGPGSVGRHLLVMTLTITSLILISSGIGLYGTLSQTGPREAVTAAISPARDANADIHRSMVEAQSGLRGYGLVQRVSLGGSTAAIPALDAEGREYVKPYLEARSRIGSELTALDAYTTDPRFGTGAASQQIRELAQRQREVVDEWWAYGEDARTAPRLSVGELERGREIYDRFNSVNDDITGQIDTLREEGRTEIHDRITWTARSLVLASTSAVLLALIIGWRTQVALTGPILALRDTVRRQRDGERDAWADTEVGAAEVRDLATDVNVLTAEQHSLVDRQADAIRLQKAEAQIIRAVRDAGSLNESMRLATQGVAEALHVPRAVGAHLDENGDVASTTAWERDRGTLDQDLPDGLGRATARLARRLWEGNTSLVITDVTTYEADESTAYVPEIVAEFRMEGALVMVAFGLGSRPLGTLAVRSMKGARTWTDDEVAFVQHVSAKLAHQAMAFERDQQRDEHMRRLEDLDRQKDVFLSTISHELRTPLTSITGYLEMLEDGDAGALTAPQTKMVDVIRRNAQRLRGLIEDLLVLNRLEATVQQTCATEISTADLVREVAEELLPMARAAEVELRTETPGDVTVRGDRIQLGRALANVVSNGVKFTPSGGSVTLTSRLIEGGRFVEIACTDTGMGIPAADQERLFTRFFRASNATTAQVPGTGLGLVIVRGIVERHGGHLELTSVENEGTTMRLILATAGHAVTAHV